MSESNSTDTPLLRLRRLSKVFPGVKALSEVDFTLRRGEIHALMGENGAGKSTLIKVLTGVHRRDSGRMELEGRPIDPNSPQKAQALGISTVYQEVNLIPHLSVAENITLGRQPTRFGCIQWKKINEHAEQSLARLGVRVDVTASLSSCSIAIQQLVAIARALDVSAESVSENVGQASSLPFHGASSPREPRGRMPPEPADKMSAPHFPTRSKLLILDEPTSSLDTAEVDRLFSVLRRLKSEGLGILFVTHFLDQVYAISDRITVLRNGQRVGEYQTAALPRLQLVARMIGREAFKLTATPVPPAITGPSPKRSVLLRACGFGKKNSIEAFDLEIGEKEVIGLAGLLGSGRTEMARLLFGIDQPDQGTLFIADQPTRIKTPRRAIHFRFGFCPEDRKREGIVPSLSLRQNIILGLQARQGWFKSLSRQRQNEIAGQYIRSLNIVPSDPERPIKFLSGGNQQKALLARWLAAEPRLLILDEPTRGIDVGAKSEIEKLMRDLAAQGMAILFISSELEEVVRNSHRVIVLRDRRKIAELSGDQITESAILHAIAAPSAERYAD